MKNIFKQGSIVFIAAFILAALGTWLMHDERLGNVSTENFYKVPETIVETIWSLK